MKVLSLFLSLLLMVFVQGCQMKGSGSSEMVSASVDMFSIEKGVPTLGQIAETGDLAAVVNPMKGMIYIDPENEKAFVETFDGVSKNNRWYFAKLGENTGYQFRSLSVADYSEKVLHLHIWMHGRKCKWIKTDTCINTVGYERAKSFKLNGSKYLCVVSENRSDRCLLNYFQPQVQSFYTEKNCKGTPSFDRRDTVKIPVCSGAR